MPRKEASVFPVRPASAGTGVQPRVPFFSRPITIFAHDGKEVKYFTGVMERRHARCREKEAPIVDSREEEVGKAICVPLVLCLVFAAACVSEVKPLLRPAEPDLGERIASQQKQLDLSLAAGALSRQQARTLQENLDGIKETYSRLQAEGRLTPKEIASLHRMLDKNSDAIFRARQSP